MDIFKKFATDADREINGTWVELEDSKFKIARVGNRLHTRIMTALYKEHRVALESKDEAAAAATDEKLNVEAIAKGILLDWETVEYQGEKLDYTTENAIKLLAHVDFRSFVMGHSRNFDLFKAHKEEEAKNG